MNSLIESTCGRESARNSKKIELVINGKFLRPTAGKSGVYRVACELLLAIDSLLLKSPDISAKFSCRIIGVGSLPPEFRLTEVLFERSGSFANLLNDTVWEQIILPMTVRGRVLLNPCNVGPGLYRNAFTMIHDAQVYESPRSYSYAFRSWYRFIQPMLGRTNKSILTVSSYSRDQLVKHEVAPASRIRVIYNGCDHVHRLTPDASIVERSGLKGRRYVVALSNTQVHKNIEVLFKAFTSELLVDVSLALFGSATRLDFERLGHSVPPNVIFIGRINDQELCGLLQSSVALAFPSLTEGFGLPPLEAMALGCPAIVAPCGALPEVCGDAALWADPHEPSQWVRHILQLCNEPEYKAAASARGLSHSENFTWENAARNMLEVIAENSRPHRVAH